MIAVVTVYRDEARHLEEWAAWHRAFGVDHFLLYDNDSVDGGVLEGADVHTIRWPGPTPQVPVYRDALRRLGRVAEWVAFIDVDEFLWSPEGARLPDVLASFAQAANLWAPWRMFGWGPHLTRPPAGVVSAYRWRAEDDDPLHRTHGKSLVRPDRVRGIITPHHFAVTGAEVEEAPLLCNHYFTRSREEALRKCARPRCDTGGYRDWETEFEGRAARYAAVKDERLAAQQARLIHTSEVPA